MENLKKIVVEDYLKKETDYALLITGEWGCGKTHYYKNVLRGEIEKTKSFRGKKKYKSIHISLFGLSTIVEIQNKILTEIILRSWAKNKAAKRSMNLLKGISRGLFSFSKLGDIDKYLNDIDLGNLINYDELVICLDDLERKDSRLTIKEVIGFINNLVENQNLKFLIITNEDKVTNDSDYKEFKEKVVGLTIEFIPNFEEQIKSIIEYKYAKSYREFTKFIYKHIDVINSISDNYKNNLRTFIFSTHKLEQLFSELSKNNIINLINEEQLNKIIHFTIVISIEYKNNKISYKNREQLDNKDVVNHYYNIKNPRTDFSNDSNESYLTKFIDHYYNSPEEYRFYESIYSFVTGANLFDAKQLAKEVDLEMK